MAKLDVLKTIEKTRERIADRYDVYPEDLTKIMKKICSSIQYCISSAYFRLCAGSKGNKIGERSYDFLYSHRKIMWFIRTSIMYCRSAKETCESGMR